VAEVAVFLIDEFAGRDISWLCLSDFGCPLRGELFAGALLTFPSGLITPTANDCPDGK
jgi:hypothetical protein